MSDFSFPHINVSNSTLCEFLYQNIIRGKVVVYFWWFCVIVHNWGISLSFYGGLRIAGMDLEKCSFLHANGIYFPIVNLQGHVQMIYKLTL